MKNTEPEIIEAEIVEDSFATQNAKKTILGAHNPPSGRPAWSTPGDHARPQGDTSGLVGGFVTLLVGLTVTVCVILFTVCILIPVALIGRIVGMPVKTFRR